MPPTLAPPITFRVLPVDEWSKLVDMGIEPFATYGLPQQPEGWCFLVAEQDGRILGLSGLYNCVHNDPWWISPDARHSVTIVKGLWRETKKVLDEAGVGFLYATVANEQPDVQAMVERMGYMAAPGKLFLLPVANCVLNEKE